MKYSIIIPVLLLTAVCGIPALSAADNQQGGIVSFSAEIAADGTPVQAAPGTEHNYATGTLRKGDIVEIFYKNKEGWCAVRPPEGSYSWINGNFVRPNQDGTGTIISPSADKEVPVRVGTDSVLKSTSVQVGLKSGRTVAILGETTLTGGKKWYKIAPPAGEFRWIHEKSLVSDIFLTYIPDHLTREGEFSIASHQAPVQTAGQAPEAEVEMLPSSAIKPVQSGTLPAKDSSNGGAFHLELARIYRDLFSAVEKSGSSETFDLLADRASTLFNAADNDDERIEAQKLYQKIRTYRSGTMMPSGTYIPSGNAQEVAARTLYRYPINPSAGQIQPGTGSRIPQNSRSIAAAGIPSSGQKEKFAAGKNTAAANTAKKEKKDHLQFAFADGRGPFSGQSKQGNKKNSGLAIVPPANYQTVQTETAAASLYSRSQGIPMIGAMVAERHPNTNPPKLAAAAVPKPDAVSPAAAIHTAAKAAAPQSSASMSDIPAPAMLPGPTSSSQPNPGPNPGPNQSSPLPASEHPSSSAAPVLADNPSAVRPVSALEISPRSEEKPDSAAAPVELWVPPKPLNETSLSEPAPAGGENFDAVGILGRFPNRPDGYPPYALVRNDGDRLVILSYITPDKGVKLDPYIGKRVGINGTRGWFQKGEENRRLVTAKIVFELGNEPDKE